MYFLFYETAIEVKTEQVYSRVARICKNDIGSGQEYFSNYFLSFRYFSIRLQGTYFVRLGALNFQNLD